MLFAQMQSNIYDVLIVALPGIIAAISSIVMGIINNKKTQENKIAIDNSCEAINTNILATNKNKRIISQLSNKINGNLDALIEAKEKLAFIKGVESINVSDIYKVSEQIDGIWKHLKDRALAEALLKGFVYFHDDKLIVSDEIRLGYEFLLSELKKWYQDNKELDDLGLFKSCQQKFSAVLIEKICSQYNMFDGSCVQIAIMLAKEE